MASIKKKLVVSGLLIATAVLFFVSYFTLVAAPISQPVNSSTNIKIINDKIFPFEFQRQLAPENRQIQYHPERRYSTYHCAGADSHRVYWKRNYCVFRNVCLDPKNVPKFDRYFHAHPMYRIPNITFYEDPDSPCRMPKRFMNGTFYDSFPRFVECRESPYEVNVVREHIPSDAIWVKEKVVAMGCNPAPQNFGHNFMDGVFPYFATAVTLQLWDPKDFRIVWTNALWGDQDCNGFFDRWARPGGVVHPTGNCNISEFVSTDRITCFHNLILGAYAYGYENARNPDVNQAGMGHLWRKMRDVVRWNLAGLTMYDGPSRHHVVILQKPIKRRLKNSMEVAESIRETFPGIPVTVTQPDLLTPLEQILLVNNATVVISPAGTTGVIVMFGPEGQAGIFLDLLARHNKMSTSLEQFIYSNYPWLHQLHYSIDNPKSELQWIDRHSLPRMERIYFHPNNRDVVANLTKMLRLVYWGLRYYRDHSSEPKKFEFQIRPSDNFP